jgi:hypothetical protein
MMWYGVLIEVEVVDEELFERMVVEHGRASMLHSPAASWKPGSPKRHLPKKALGSVNTIITQQISLHASVGV